MNVIVTAYLLNWNWINNSKERNIKDKKRTIQQNNSNIQLKVLNIMMSKFMS